MKVKIVTHFSDENADYAHVDLNKKPIIADVRESIAKNWIEKGWAVARPDLEIVETVAIETPETGSAPENRETATIKRGRRGRILDES